MIFQTISGSRIQETPPPAYRATIQSGNSLFVPPSYKMISGQTHHSMSVDSYGGIPDYSRISEGINPLISGHKTAYVLFCF